MTSNRSATLVEAIWPAHGSSILKSLVIVILGSLLLTLSAKIHVPFWPVPMTMQTFAVMVLAAALGSRLGTATVLLYLAEGAFGLPVFSGTPERGIGLAYMMGPTGGYLVGFALAAYLIGWLAERRWDRSIAWLALAMAIGHVLVFVPGYVWLAYLFGPEKAWIVGVSPFIVASIFKTALAALVLPAAWAVTESKR